MTLAILKSQLIENPRDFACQDLEKKINKILARFISWVFNGWNGF